MANDRLWIRCQQCGEKKLLVKYYPSPDSAYVWNPEELDDWFMEHLFATEGHDKTAYQMRLPKAVEIFTLETESDE